VMDKFWETKSLDQMTHEEWESLCDGCARCCMFKVEDDSGTVHYTSLVCDQLNLESCRCSNYEERHKIVRDCVKFSAEEASSFKWLPRSCAYRSLAEGRGLEDWHPLISGRDESVHEAAVSVKNKVLPVGAIHEDEYAGYFIDWIEA